MMSLEELYLQYEEAIKKQKSTIEENRALLKKARTANNLGEIARLNRYIKVLYEEKLELEGHAVSIREYFRAPGRSVSTCGAAGIRNSEFGMRN